MFKANIYRLDDTIQTFLLTSKVFHIYMYINAESNLSLTLCLSNMRGGQMPGRGGEKEEKAEGEMEREKKKEREEERGERDREREKAEREETGRETERERY